MEILARLISKGWAAQFPVMAEIVVLSEAMIVPKSVPFRGSAVCKMPAVEDCALTWNTNKNCHTCIFHAASPDNHSVYVRVVFAALS